MARRLSYSQEVKNELARIFGADVDLLRAELAAMLAVNGSKVDGRMEFITSNAAVARKVVALIKKIFIDAKIEVAAVRRKVLQKTMKYAVRIFFTSQTENFLNDLFSENYFEKIVNRPILGVAYLRGAFLANGSVNRPEKNYLLDISFLTKSAAEFTQKVFKIFGMYAGLYERRGFFVIYVKEGDSICDTLGIIGAEKAVERFEVARNLKEVRAMVNRIVNCETANLNRTIEAAQRQIADIRQIIAKKIKVADYLQRTMKFRLKYPDDSVAELAAKMGYTKPAVMHHFKLIRELATS